METISDYFEESISDVMLDQQQSNYNLQSFSAHDPGGDDDDESSEDDNPPIDDDVVHSPVNPQTGGKPGRN